MINLRDSARFQLLFHNKHLSLVQSNALSLPKVEVTARRQFCFQQGFALKESELVTLCNIKWG